jgi:hypothetical protein
MLLWFVDEAVVLVRGGGVVVVGCSSTCARVHNDVPSSSSFDVGCAMCLRNFRATETAISLLRLLYSSPRN